MPRGSPSRGGQRLEPPARPLRCRARSIDVGPSSWESHHGLDECRVRARRCFGTLARLPRRREAQELDHCIRERRSIVPSGRVALPSAQRFVRLDWSRPARMRGLAGGAGQDRKIAKSTTPHRTRRRQVQRGLGRAREERELRRFPRRRRGVVAREPRGAFRTRVRFEVRRVQLLGCRRCLGKGSLRRRHRRSRVVRHSACRRHGHLHTSPHRANAAQARRDTIHRSRLATSPGRARRPQVRAQGHRCPRRASRSSSPLHRRSPPLSLETPRARRGPHDARCDRTVLRERAVVRTPAQGAKEVALARTSAHDAAPPSPLHEWMGPISHSPPSSFESLSSTSFLTAASFSGVTGSAASISFPFRTTLATGT